MPKDREYTIQDFVAAYNDTGKNPTLQDVADALGISKKTVRNKAGTLRAKRAAGDTVTPVLINRAKDVEPPMSEDARKFYPDWTSEQCIEELRRVQEANPEQFITRNFFRNNSIISDGTWDRHFGTFEEFRRQAGLQLSRGQGKLERDIAKHASRDVYRELDERKNWGEDYIKESQGRFKTALIASDLHDIEVDSFWLRTFIDTARRVQPDIIILAGDIFDLPEFGKYGVDPREWDVVGRIKYAHNNIFRALREVCPDTQIDLIEGNHERRLLRHLADATPALRAVLSDLHGMSMRDLFALDEFQVNYISQGDLAVFNNKDDTKELSRNYKVYWDTLLIHHFPHAKNYAMPGCNGHHHRHQVWPLYNPMFGAYEWHQLGCGHRRGASYCEAEQWHMGFALAHVDTNSKTVNWDYVQVTDHAVVGGKWYSREPGEV